MLYGTFQAVLRDTQIHDDLRAYCRDEGVDEDYLRSSFARGLRKARPFARFRRTIFKAVNPRGNAGRQAGRWGLPPREEVWHRISE